MRHSALETWKARLRAADAVLAASPKEVGERLATKTLASTTEALRACIQRLEITLGELEAVRESARAAQQEDELLLRSLPIAHITTSRSGEILTANPEAAVVLNTSTRHMIGKSLLLFLEDRGFWETTLRSLLKFDAPVRRLIALRPRERARKQMLACVSWLDAETMRWFLLPPGSHKDDAD